MQEDDPTAGLKSLLYIPGEPIFGFIGPMMWERGWSVWPQERDGRRTPSRVNDYLVKWGEFRTRLATPAEMKDFCRDAGGANVAIALGDASGRTFAVDVDCMTPEVSQRVQEIAFEVLGQTPLVRIGRAPKAALFYRYPEGQPPRSRSVRFAEHEDCALEILGAGKAITMCGLHHATSQWFRWPESMPLTAGPEAAPEVTPERVEEFLSAVEAEFPFVVPPTRAAVAPRPGTVRAGQVEGIVMPARREGERLTDGREEYLRNLAWEAVRLNGHALLRARDAGQWDEMIEQVKAAVVRQFEEECEMSGRWNGELPAAAAARVNSAGLRLVNGEMRPAPEQAAPVPLGQHYMDLDSVLGREPPRLDFVLPGLLSGTLGVLVSPGGAGKSMLALGLASCVAAGRSLWNLLPGDPTAGNALLVSAEDPSAILTHRLHAMMNLPEGGDALRAEEFRKRLRIKALHGTGFTLGTWNAVHGFNASSAFDALKAEVEEMRPRLIIIDTLNRVLGGIPENDNGAIGRIVSELETMVAPVGAACLVLHHVSKGAARDGQGDEQQAARGAGAITDNARWQSNLVGMTREEAEKMGLSDEDRSRWVRWTNPKSNYAPRQPERWLRRERGGVLVGAEPPKAMTGKERLREMGRRMKRDNDD